ncbi:MAG: hypothetical protein ACRD2R_07310, partial [Terriglobales bacterium]
MSSLLKHVMSLFLCVAGVGAAALAQEPARTLRYDLQPGDHLVYEQHLESESSGDPMESLIRRSWTNHALVLGEQRGGWLIGFQRNRTSFELLRFKVRGQDRLREQQQTLNPLLKRTARFGEANRLTVSGAPQLSWQIVREASSKVLYDVHEFPPLPEQPVRVGDTWTAPTLLGFSFGALGWEVVQGEDCLHVEGEAEKRSLLWRYWFCPGSGMVRRLELAATYRGMVRNTIHEKLVVELVERRREEKVEDWLVQPDLERGVLAALLVSDTLPVDLSLLYKRLDGSDAAVQRMVLGLAYRRDLPPPGLDQVKTLLASDSARVRTLA